MFIAAFYISLGGKPLFGKALLEFVIRGFIDADPNYSDVETEGMFFHFKYLKESLGGGANATHFNWLAARLGACSHTGRMTTRPASPTCRASARSPTRFGVTSRIITSGLAFALAVGVVGGLLPALRAARPIAAAVRAA